MNDRATDGPLRATVVTPAEGLDLAARAETADPAADFAGSATWLQAAAEVLGEDRLVHVALTDRATGELAGALALQSRRAGWRTGSPGRASLGWPFAEVGYGFRPRWFGAARPAHWLPALRELFPGHRLDLQRCAPDALPDALPHGFVRTEGPGTWVLAQPGSTEQWLGSLYGKHRRDLAKYRRDIQKAGGQWLDGEAADPALLDACFRLHRARLQDKGAQRAWFAAPVELFLRKLAQGTAGRGLRLSLLARDGRYVAACLSFVHRRRFKAFVSGWDRAHARLDLGRQVLYHQLLGELPRGLDEIDFLGGDLAYKREFGLHRQPTADVIAHGGTFAALRARAVAGAIAAVRSVRRRLRAEALR
ncbi:MAG: GNAT family N-acetyltransferase [Planctomycetes bacterium]|nr:GNAT family N-acetyltransferase [Planctomycetota bacterium]